MTAPASPATEVATDYQREQASLASAAAQVAGQMWSEVDPDNIAASWRAQLPEVTAVVSGAQLAAARQADPYTNDVLDAQGLGDEAVGVVNPPAFAGVANDGGALMSLLTNPVFVTLATIADGVDVAQALGRGRSNLEMLTHTQVADAGRFASHTSLVAHTGALGYVRQTDGNPCGRCLILSGRFYQWNRGFLRHPRCSCVHIPAGTQAARQIRDPREIYDQMTPRERTAAGFSRADQLALAEGADINQVVNTTRGAFLPLGPGQIRRRRLPAGITTEGTTPRGLFAQQARREGRAGAARLTPNQILLEADSRAEAIALLRRNAYLIDAPLPVVRDSATVTARGTLTPRPALVAARTVAEIDAALAREFLQVTGRDVWVEFAGSAATAREHAEGILRVAEEFPDVPLSSVRVGPTGAGEYATTVRGGEVVFSDDWSAVGSRRDYLAAVQADARTGWHPPAGGSPAGTALHETAHLLPFDEAAVRQIIDAGGGARRISGYAARNLDEAVAEAVADVLANGARASALSRQVFDHVRSFSRARANVVPLGPSRQVLARDFAARRARIERDFAARRALLEARAAARAELRELRQAHRAALRQLRADEAAARRALIGERAAARVPSRSLPSTPATSSLTVTRLRAEVAARNITVPTGLRKPDLVQLVDDLQGGMTPALARQRAVRAILEEREGVATALTEAAAMAASGGSARALQHLGASLRARLTADQAKTAAALLRALDAGNASEVLAALPVVARAAKLKPVGAAQAVAPMDRTRMLTIGADDVPAGGAVRVIRPGYETTFEGQTTLLSRAAVVRSDVPLPTKATKAAPRKAAAAPALRPVPARSGVDRVPRPHEAPSAEDVSHARADIVAKGVRFNPYNRTADARTPFLAEFRDRYPSTFARVVQEERSALEMQRWAQRFNVTGTPAEIKAAVEREIRKNLAIGQLVVRQRTLASQRGILRSGRMKNQFEVRKSSAAFDPSGREAYERAMWGYADDVNPAERPIFGYMSSPDLDESAWHAFYDTHSAMEKIRKTDVRGFGDVRWVLKDEVRDRTSFTVGDSFFGGEFASPMKDPDWKSFKFRTLGDDPAPPGSDWWSPEFQWQTDYVEIQVHGGVTLDDVREVIFDNTPPIDVIELLAQRGIPWRLTADLDMPTPGGAPVKAAKAAVKKAAPAKKAAAAPDLTGARGLSDVPAVREVQIENRIREAYQQAPQMRAGGGVWLADLRNELGETINRHELDDALRRIGRDRDASLLPNENRKEFDPSINPRGPARREAGVPIGPVDYHILRLQNATLRPLPAVPVKAAKKAAAPKPPPVPDRMTPAALRTELRPIIDAAPDQWRLTTADLASVPKPTLAQWTRRARELDPRFHAEEVGRWRQVIIDRQRAVAELLAEADELIANQASASAMGIRARGRLRRIEAQLAGWPGEASARAVVSALATGNQATIRRAVAAAQRKLGLRQVGDNAGTVGRYDGGAMSPIGSPIPDGASVIVVRPGYEIEVGGQRIVLSRPVVQEFTPPPVPVKMAPAKKVAPRKAAPAKATPPRTGDDALRAAPAGLDRSATGLTPAQAQAVQDYKGVMGYRRVNQTLRSGGELTDEIRLIDEAMAASRLRGDVVVYRGIRDGGDVFGSRFAGDLTSAEFTDLAFVSTTQRVATAENIARHGFAPESARRDPLVMRILAPRGTGAVEVTDTELLLDRGLRFRVVADRGIVDGARRLDVEVIR